MAIKMYYGGVSSRGVGKILGMNKPNIMNWIKRDREERAAASARKREAERRNGTIELGELHWFVKFKPHTETRENVYILTMVSRIPRQIVSHVVSRDKSCQMIQGVVDHAPDVGKYCTDGYAAYREVVYPGRHIFNNHDKRDIFTVEGVNADLRHYIPTLVQQRRLTIKSQEGRGKNPSPKKGGEEWRERFKKRSGHPHRNCG